MNNSIADAESREVEATLTPFNVQIRRDVLLQILEKYVNFV